MNNVMLFALIAVLCVAAVMMGVSAYGTFIVLKSFMGS